MGNSRFPEFSSAKNPSSSIVRKSSLPLCINTTTGEVHFAGNESITSQKDGNDGTEIIRLTNLLNLGSPYDISKANNSEHQSSSSNRNYYSPVEEAVNTSGYHSEVNFRPPEQFSR